MKVIVINGPNLNLLGIREPEVYGKLDYEQLCEYITDAGNSMGIEVSLFQSNIEGELINAIHNSRGECDAIIINPGAYTHYSYAIFDAILAVSIPAIEVHISNVYKREGFRHKSVTAPACMGQITGLGVYGYIAALRYLTELEIEN